MTVVYLKDRRTLTENAEIASRMARRKSVLPF